MTVPASSASPATALSTSYISGTAAPHSHTLSMSSPSLSTAAPPSSWSSQQPHQQSHHRRKGSMSPPQGGTCPIAPAVVDLPDYAVFVGHNSIAGRHHADGFNGWAGSMHSADTWGTGTVTVGGWAGSQMQPVGVAVLSVRPRSNVGFAGAAEEDGDCSSNCSTGGGGGGSTQRGQSVDEGGRTGHRPSSRLN